MGMRVSTNRVQIDSPFSARVMDTRRRALRTLLSVVALGIAFRVPMFVELQLARSTPAGRDGEWILVERHSWSSNMLYNLLYYLTLNTLVGHVLPFVMLLVCCAVTLRIVNSQHLYTYTSFAKLANREEKQLMKTEAKCTNGSLFVYK